MFIANEGNSTVAEYASPFTGSATTLTSGVNRPSGLWVDNANNLIVANANNTMVYPSPWNGSGSTAVGTVAQTGTIYQQTLFMANSANPNILFNYVAPYTSDHATTEGISGATVLTHDSSGNVFVGNATAGTVTEYSPPYYCCPTNKLQLSYVGIKAVAGTVDASGNLYVATNGLSVQEFSPPYSSAGFGKTFGLGSLEGSVNGMTTDQYGNIYLATGMGVFEYEPTSFELIGSYDWGSNVSAIAFDPSGYLWACVNQPPTSRCDQFNTQIPTQSEARQTITNGISSPTAIAFGTFIGHIIVGLHSKH